MADRLKTIAFVTLLAAVVWLFAEAESLGESELSARIEFPPPGASPFLITSDPRNPAIRLGLRGAKSALQRAASAFETPIRLEPGSGSIPDAAGNHTVDLLEAIRASTAIADTRVTVEWARPPTISLRLQGLETKPLRIQADLPGIQTEGPIEITPPQADVRAPTDIHAQFEQAFIQAKLPPDQTELAPGPHTISVPLQLPPGLRANAGVSLQTDRAQLKFTVVSTLITDTFPSVPVQVLLAPTEASEWRVTIVPEDQILSIEMTGPRQVMADIKSADGGTSVVAVLSLSDIELQSGVSSKPVTFSLLRNGTVQSPPREVSIRANRSEVRFNAQRLAPQ